MSSLAGFCATGHPLGPTEAERPKTRDFLIVRHHGGKSEPADCYALAARWCALGGFVPISWRSKIGLDDILALGAEARRRICEAIERCGGQVEIAFRLGRAPVGDPGAGSSPGRAYLDALKRRDEAGREFLHALSACAVGRGYALSLTTATPSGVAGLLRCGAAQLAEARQAAEGIAAALHGAELSLSGALPPFGAGVELLERIGLNRARTAA